LLQFQCYRYLGRKGNFVSRSVVCACRRCPACRHCISVDLLPNMSWGGKYHKVSDQLDDVSLNCTGAMKAASLSERKESTACVT
jgi:hypothetical protein